MRTQHVPRIVAGMPCCGEGHPCYCNTMRAGSTAGHSVLLHCLADVIALAGEAELRDIEAKIWCTTQLDKLAHTWPRWYTLYALRWGEQAVVDEVFHLRTLAADASRTEVLACEERKNKHQPWHLSPIPKGPSQPKNVCIHRVGKKHIVAKLDSFLWTCARGDAATLRNLEPCFRSVHR